MITTQCAILIGGLGTRLGALTQHTPKPLLPIGGKPFLDVLVDEARRRGFDDVVLLAGHKSGAVRDYAEGLQRRVGDTCRITVSVEPEPLGTGGAVTYAADLLQKRFLLLNGDTWFDFNWLDLATFSNGRTAVAAREAPTSERYESLVLGEGGVVRELRVRGGVHAALINGGVYHFNKSDFDGFEGRFSIEEDVLPALIGKSLLRAKQYSGFFLDIGVPDAFEEAQSTIPAHRRRPALFLDRDGVLIHDDNYVGSPERARWINGANDAVRLANDLGYYVFVVTNQAGVARGLYSEADVQALHRWMADELRERGAWVDDWRYCPFHPEGVIDRYKAFHPWRKPEPGMIIDLLEHWPVEVEGSALIGDKASDCEAATKAGIDALLFEGGNLREFLSSHLNRRQNVSLADRS